MKALLDVEHAAAPDSRVIQLMPQGSGTSIQFGVGLTDAPQNFRDADGNAWVLQQRNHQPI
jgi:hypothetical protein